MRGKDWRGKGEVASRRSPRKTGKKCGRPFTAPRTVRENCRTTTKRKTTETEDSDVQVMTDSEVQKITEGAKTMEAKTFDGVEFKGTVDSFRQARTRFYYHVTYTDGDEEELSQTELRDGYILGLSDEIERQWQTYKDSTKQDKIVDQANDNSEDEGSDGEGSQYDNTDFNEEVREKRNQRVDKREKKQRKKNANCRVLYFRNLGTKMYQIGCPGEGRRALC
jgi:hypothetical protein